MSDEDSKKARRLRKKEQRNADAALLASQRAATAAALAKQQATQERLAREAQAQREKDELDAKLKAGLSKGSSKWCPRRQTFIPV